MGSLFSFLFKSLLYVLLFQLVAGSDRIVPLEKLSVGQTLVSAGQIFELGFFSPTNSGRQYIGVWYKNIPKQKVVWVANRQNPLPLTDNMASLMIGSDGNLRILDGKQNTIWTTNISKLTNDTFGLLSDSGEFVMRNNASGIDLWKSFDYPCDTFLVDMAVGINTRTGERRFLSSWTSEDDPSPGNFLVGISLALPVQAFVWNKSTIHWRSGPWNGQSFVGIPDMATSTIDNFAVETINQEGTFYVTYNEYDQSFVMVLGISPVGSLDMVSWNAEKQNWEVSWTSQENHCDVYGTCGPSGLCDATKSPICECLQGFVPRSYADWKRGSWSSGCVRRTELECQKNASHNLAPRTGKNDGFKKFSGLKIPDNYELLYDNEDAQGCEKWCLDNCSCIAYAFVTGIGCLAWSGELTDMQRFQLTGEDLFVRLAFSELDHANGGRKILIISLTTTATFIIMFFAIYIMCMRRAQQRDWFLLLRKGKLQERFAADSIETSKEMPPEIVWELPSLDFEKILDATHCFDQRNKLGEGGFGAVFWGKLQDGQEIAVKRLSTLSRQGVEEFKNEILLISKLQHRNLVRILGCCIKGEEKLIVYEWMPNKSLDTFLFDSQKRKLLNWATCFQIIHGVAKGLLYLHRDSRLRIIHRDLKASNILLDDSMNPKISDFGLARTFLATQESAKTVRVVGTYGYMSPEYAMRGILSEKSDVFSFGVLLIEIISGKKNSSFFCDDLELYLLSYAWWLLNEGRGLELMDEALAKSSYSSDDVLRCLQIGLLCVQDHSSDRPTMPDVVLMLRSQASLLQPKKPTFCPQTDSKTASSLNEATMSSFEGR